MSDLRGSWRSVTTYMGRIAQKQWGIAASHARETWPLGASWSALTCWVQTDFSHILSHWGRDKMAANFLMTFSNAFSWMKLWVSLKISLKFAPMGPIDNIPALAQIMAWRRPGHKPLSEPMTISLLTHICVTRPQWVIGCISTETKRSSGWQLWYSLETLKLVFNVSREYQGCHPDDLFVSVSVMIYRV